MISSAQAFEIAHEAIAGKQYHDAPCDIEINREGVFYTVTFSSPPKLVPGTPPRPTRVTLDAGSGAVREVRDATQPDRNPREAGLISGKRAFEVGVATIREAAVSYDEHWTVTVNLRGDKYSVNFPLPESARAAARRADYALQVWVNARTGNLVDVVHAS